MDDRSSSTFDYARPERRTATRRQATAGAAVLVVVLIAMLCIAGLPMFIGTYVASRYQGVQIGMTQAEVDRHLWAFTRRPGQYNSMLPGESAVAYHLFGLGEQIKIIIDANGVVTSVIPSFGN